ncbi:hypothetical protein [Mangrovicella endophytica]|uniref:hypothetical protein n=1 Tax=Mangrovicella endophytica TaxID=2066697 RepID=UPI000C9E229D|nr:hypothetical protein [Mangrovicella endophytica]
MEWVSSGRKPSRFDEAELMVAAIRVLAAEGFDRPVIERTLMNIAPVDLDLLHDCLDVIATMTPLDVPTAASAAKAA